MNKKRSKKKSKKSYRLLRFSTIYFPKRKKRGVIKKFRSYSPRNEFYNKPSNNTQYVLMKDKNKNMWVEYKPHNSKKRKRYEAFYDFGNQLCIVKGKYIYEVENAEYIYYIKGKRYKEVNLRKKGKYKKSMKKYKNKIY